MGIHSPQTGSPESYVGGAAVSLHDTNELDIYAKALYVGVAGDVKLTTTEGSTITIKANKGLLPVTAKVVFSTGTTATDIVALW